ncbi:10977_t:CDS:2 [Diversispora eburnea]|uniref:10977_t:CDS:1 n=1 Tax=Diversispora eburnea TaxID=1213867 RepID=A0A9N9AR35_9GLOM|nr:10977_t:CDS:2 [Diversispora eburnea]
MDSRNSSQLPSLKIGVLDFERAKSILPPGLELLLGENIEFIAKTSAIKLFESTGDGGFRECGGGDLNRYCNLTDVGNESTVLITNYRICYQPLKNSRDSSNCHRINCLCHHYNTSSSLPSSSPCSTNTSNILKHPATNIYHTTQIPHLSISQIDESQAQITLSLKFSPSRYLFKFSKPKPTMMAGNFITSRTTANSLCRDFTTIIKRFVYPSSLENVFAFRMARFRSRGRFPVICWKKGHNVLMRSGQPMVGFLGSRGLEDEELMREVIITIDEEQQVLAEKMNNKNILNDKVENNHTSIRCVDLYEPCNMKLCILDARSYAAAFSNGYQGGGYEKTEHYPPNTTLQFLGLPNIHVISASHTALLRAINTNASSSNWYSVLENTGWLGHVADLLRAAGGKDGVIGKLVDEDASVLVHCTDGWDRTTQLGLQVLIEKEWIAFGHPFRSRSDLPCDLRNNDIMSHAKGKSSSLRSRKEPPQLPPAPAPVFLLFLTCLHHLLQQFPSAFEFNDFFLLCLARAAAGNSPYGDFICNTEFERETVQLRERTKSIWTLFKERKQWFRNTHYQRNRPSDLIRHNDHNNTWNDHSWKKDVLKPDTGARVITLWSQYYFPKDDYSIALLSAPSGTEVSLLRNPTQQYHPYHLGGFPSEYYLVSLFMKRRKRRIAEKVWTVWRSFVLEKKRNSFERDSSSQKDNKINERNDTTVENEDEKWDILAHVSLAVPQKTIHDMQSKISLSSPLSMSPPTYTPFNDFLQDDDDIDIDIEKEANLMISSELCESQFLEWVHLSGQDEDSDTAKILAELLKEAQMDEYYCQNIIPESERLKDLLREAQIDKQVFYQNFCRDNEALTEMLKDAQTENPYLTKRIRRTSSTSNSNRNHVTTENSTTTPKSFINVSKIPSRPIVINCAEKNKSSSDLSSEFVFV